MRKNRSPNERGVLFRRDDYTCRYCGNGDDPENPLELDHVYPISRGGEDVPENIVVSCLRCNRRKHTNIMWPMPRGFFSADRPIPSSHTLFWVLLSLGLIAFLQAGTIQRLWYNFTGVQYMFMGLGVFLVVGAIIVYFFKR